MCYTDIPFHYLHSIMSNPTYAELHLDARANVVRKASLGAVTPPALRLCYDGDTPLFMTGTPQAPRFHDARTIIAGLLEGADDFELPLPAPVQDPLYGIPDAERAMLLEYAAGVDRDFLKNKYGAALCTAATEGATARNTPIVTAKNASPLVEEVRETLAREAREREAAAQVAVALDRGTAAIDVDNTPEPEPVQYGVITKATPQEYARMTRRAGRVRTDARVVWPFKDMQIGDKVVINAQLAKRAQTAVHVYASRTGKRFTTESRGRGGDLVVCRAEDRAVGTFM